MINEKDVKVGKKYKLATGEICEVVNIYKWLYPKDNNLYVTVKYVKGFKKFLNKNFELLLEDFCHLYLITETQRG